MKKNFLPYSLHLKKIQKTLILAFEAANSTLPCQNGPLYVLKGPLLRNEKYMLDEIALLAPLDLLKMKNLKTTI